MAACLVAVIVGLIVLWSGRSNSGDDPLGLGGDPISVTVTSAAVEPCSYEPLLGCRQIELTPRSGDFNGERLSLEQPLAGPIRDGDSILVDIPPQVGAPPGLLLAGVVIGSLGVLDDVTVTQVSAVWELKHAKPAADFAELYGRAVRIGRDHIFLHRQQTVSRLRRRVIATAVAVPRCRPIAFIGFDQHCSRCCGTRDADRTRRCRGPRQAVIPPPRGHQCVRRPRLNCADARGTPHTYRVRSRWNRTRHCAPRAQQFGHLVDSSGVLVFDVSSKRRHIVACVGA